MQSINFNNFKEHIVQKLFLGMVAVLGLILLYGLLHLTPNKNLKTIYKINPADITSRMKQPPKQKEPTRSNNITIDDTQVSRLRALLLPAPQHSKNLPVLLPPPAELPVSAPKNNMVTPTQHCIYNNQSYIPGDILKTDQGWIQCTPTIIFAPDSSSRQVGSSAWTAVQ